MQHRLYFNGVDATSGHYLLPPLTTDAIGRVARGEPLEPRELEELRARWFAGTAHLALVAGADPNDLAEAGWGVILAQNIPPVVEQALGPLLEHRRRQATRLGPYYRCFRGADGYRPGESSTDFLLRHGVAPGLPANPGRMPYYLLIVGDPETIPYRFQYQLDVTYAVGRLHFDTPEDYGRYAEKVVQSETNPAHVPHMSVFGVKNDHDGATTLSAEHLVLPLSERLAKRFPHWSVQTIVGEEATKARLGALLAGDTPPAVLLTAGHGMAFRSGDSRQRSHQGALLCQDWPGPGAWRGSIPEDFYFAGDDIDPSTPLGGLLTFFFACFSAGTPRTDDFSQQAFASPADLAPHAFLGRLPQRLLSHPRGGSLAVVGHVDRAWSYSFLWPGLGEQLDVFESTLNRILNGATVGAAVEYFNDRYAALTTELAAAKEDIDCGKLPDDVLLTGLWTARNDARNYVILGDPAVRLPSPGP